MKADLHGYGPNWSCTVMGSDHICTLTSGRNIHEKRSACGHLTCDG